jgi:MFS family permease
MSAAAEVPELGAFAEPTRRVGGRYLSTMALANLGIMLAFYAPLQNLLPRMSENLVGSGGKEGALAIVTGVGVLGSVLGQPITGALSDRTTSRWGRRKPWLLGGAVLGGITIALLPAMGSVVALTFMWLMVQFTVNATYAALTATIPDQVPVDQRGVASGLMGLAQTVGIVLGVGIVAYIVTDIVSGTAVIGLLLLVFTIPILLALHDPRLRSEDRPPFVWSEFLRGFWVSPKEYPDFAWAWVARFLVQLGNAVATVYLLFFLKDRIGMEDTAAQQAQVGLTGLYALGTILTAVVGGWISDRRGKRKRFVVVATAIMAVAALLLAFSTTLTTAYLAALVLGLGYGWYLAVDQALITQVLPAARDRARDLGVINIANAAPQVLSPVIAWVCVTHLGGYPTLYLITGVVTLLGAAAVMPIKSVP